MSLKKKIVKSPKEIEFERIRLRIYSQCMQYYGDGSFRFDFYHLNLVSGVTTCLFCDRIVKEIANYSGVYGTYNVGFCDGCFYEVYIYNCFPQLYGSGKK